jgi:hypothetical protein
MEAGHVKEFQLFFRRIVKAAIDARATFSSDFLDF